MIFRCQGSSERGGGDGSRGSRLLPFAWQGRGRETSGIREQETRSEKPCLSGVLALSRGKLAPSFAAVWRRPPVAGGGESIFWAFGPASAESGCKDARADNSVRPPLPGGAEFLAVRLNFSFARRFA